MLVLVEKNEKLLVDLLELLAFGCRFVGLSLGIMLENPLLDNQGLGSGQGLPVPKRSSRDTFNISCSNLHRTAASINHQHQQNSFTYSSSFG